MLNKILMSLCVVVGVVQLSGCILLAAGAAGAGTAKWLSEKVTQEVDQPLTKVVRAAKDTLKDLKLTVYKETNAKDVSQILAKYTDGRQVWVDIRPIDTDNTRVDVRVGWMDGETDSRKILEQIVKESKGWF